MSRISLFSLLLAFAFPVLSCAQGIGGPSLPPPNLDDAVMTAGLSTPGTDGQNWAFVVWKSPGASTLNGRAFAVYLQTAPGGGFTRQAIVTPTAEVPAIKLLVGRAQKLGADAAELDEDLRDLLRMKSWGGNVDADGIATRTSSFDSQPLENKISAVVGKALTSAEAMTAVQPLSWEHPELRMALGRAWAGPLPAGAGPMVVEVREWENGTDGVVLGRVELTPGQGVQLTAPGRIVQVPHLKPKSDLTILLRWAVPDALRRQQLHVQGFHVYRVFKDFAINNGLPLNATPAQIETFVTNHGGLTMDRVTDAPVPITRLYSDVDVDDFASFGNPQDLPDHFVADDANRDQPMTEGNLNDRYGGFSDGSRWFYFVRAVDLLGRTGPPSPVGEGIALRTIPPDVPQGLTVADLPVGPGGQRHQVLRWRANGTPQGVPGRTTQSYAVFRGYGPEHFAGTSLASLEQPFMFQQLTPIGYVSQTEADANGMLSFTDTSVTPAESNLNRSVWYAVTAIHETPLDFHFNPPHELVQSAPSAPAFGVFRDRAGPPAPQGFIQVNCGKLFTRFTGSSTAARAGNAADSKLVHLRAVCQRAGKDIKGVKFRFMLGRNPGVELHASPVLPFAEGDSVTYETSLFDAQTLSLNVTCVAYAPDGCESVLAESGTDLLTASETVWQVRSFEAGRYPATAFVPGAVMEEFGETLTFASQSATGPDTVRALLASIAHDTRTVVVQQFINFGQLGSVWRFLGVAQVRGNEVWFHHESRQKNDGLSPDYRAILLPQGGDCVCVHDARPKGEDKIIPVTISSSIPATTREWRLYRRVDDGDFALVKTLIVDPGPLAPSQVLAEDTNLPPHGGYVAYYVQCFDEHQNPGPLVYLGKITLIPDPATPVLNVPEFLPESDGLGVVRLKWFCPPAGIKNFRIDLTPMNPGDPAAIALESANLITTDIPVPVNGVIIPTSYKLAGETTWKSITAMRFFHSPDLKPAVAPAVFQADFKVTPGVTYLAWVTAIGLAEARSSTCNARLVTWSAPPAVVAESLVAWPARPLPPYVPDVSGLDAFLMSSAITSPGFDASRSTIPDAAAAALYPVGVSIGYMATGILPITHDLGDPMCVNHPVQFMTRTIASDLGQNSIPSIVFPLSKGNDPNAYLLEGALPGVLYRQTILDDGSPGALVQVTPLRMQIAHKVDTVNLFGNDYQITTIRDPFIKTLSYTVNDVTSSILTLVDTHPVEEGGRYRYFLVNYRPDGEIARIVKCGGIVTIPETP